MVDTPFLILQAGCRSLIAGAADMVHTKQKALARNFESTSMQFVYAGTNGDRRESVRLATSFPIRYQPRSIAFGVLSVTEGIRCPWLVSIKRGRATGRD
jgi:hypothetical protein